MVFTQSSERLAPMSDRKLKLTGIHYSQYEFVDHDYLDKLSKEELEWLQKFDREYYSGLFKGKAIHKNKKVTKREAWERQNESRRSVWINSERTSRPPTSYAAKLTTSDLDIKELYDNYGLNNAGEKLIEIYVDEMEGLPLSSKVKKVKEFTVKFEELKTIARREGFTKNKKYKRGKK